MDVHDALAAVAAGRGERAARGVEEELDALGVVGAAREADGHRDAHGVAAVVGAELDGGDAVAHLPAELEALVTRRPGRADRELVVGEAARLHAPAERRAERVGGGAQERALRLDAPRRNDTRSSPSRPTRRTTTPGPPASAASTSRRSAASNDVAPGSDVASSSAARR